jgi:hypothetical protein
MAVFDKRTPISRNSLKISIPIKYWDDKRQEVKVHHEVEHEKINYLLNQHKSEFLAANKRAVRTNRDCFIEFAKEHLEKEYSNIGTKIKYTTVLNSLKKYVHDVLGKETLTFKELRKIDFIVGYKKWVFKRQYNNRDKSITITNFLPGIPTRSSKLEMTGMSGIGFKKALSTGLRMKNDQAVAKLNLAAIALSQRNKKVAMVYLEAAKKLDKQKLLTAQIREIEMMMKKV